MLALSFQPYTFQKASCPLRSGRLHQLQRTAMNKLIAISIEMVSVSPCLEVSCMDKTTTHRSVRASRLIRCMEYRLVTKHQLMYNVHHELLNVLLVNSSRTLTTTLPNIALSQRRLHKLPTINETLESIDNMVNNSDAIPISAHHTLVNIVKQPTNYTLSIPLDTSEVRTYSVSTYSTLANALTPGTSFTDHQSFSAHTWTLSKHTNDSANSRQHVLSSYSSLAGALG
jgi:hypothetical protein